ncbi:hypothetical protein Vadar_024282 [Vaccinium darrowii]|uniref:Uncharacterized protein n=1 Tax=Vaccinium darrowii TaxID=229202 RepID=A0ACB7YG49_9ERIC|nr:hypothetical protein Vadar_024282 [Vaccinium darrowii]
MASYNGMRAKPPLFTLFVDNIPDKLDQSWLVTTFSKFGIVKDAFIPAKKSRRGSRFGFVRYDCSVSAGVAVHRANGMRIWNYKLHVKMASFDPENKKNGTWKLIDATRTREDSQKNPMEYWTLQEIWSLETNEIVTKSMVFVSDSLSDEK